MRDAAIVSYQVGQPAAAYAVPANGGGGAGAAAAAAAASVSVVSSGDVCWRMLTYAGVC